MPEQYQLLRPEDISVCDRYAHKKVTEKGEMLTFYDIIRVNDNGFTVLDAEGTIDFKFSDTANGILIKRKYLDLWHFMLTGIYIGEDFRKTERGRDLAGQLAQLVTFNRVFPLEERVEKDYDRFPVADEELNIPPDILTR